MEKLNHKEVKSVTTKGSAHPRGGRMGFQGCPTSREGSQTFTSHFDHSWMWAVPRKGRDLGQDGCFQLRAIPKE